MKMLEKYMLAQSTRTLTEWHCNSFTDLIDEIWLWDWNVANKDFWSRLAKSLRSQKVSVIWTEKMDQKLASVLVPENMSWATAARKCKTRIEKIGGLRVDTEPTAWGLDAQVWIKGSEFMRRSMRWEAPSMPTAAYDPGLLREQETLLEIGKNWFLDQKIPAGGSSES